MAEDWQKIANEVTDAIRSVADVSQPRGFPVTLRMPSSTGGENPWDASPGDPVYRTLHAFESVRELRDETGRLIGQTVRTLTCTAIPGVEPTEDHSIAVGITAEQAAVGAGEWSAITEVRPLAPAGIAVLYEIDILQ